MTMIRTASRQVAVDLQPPINHLTLTMIKQPKKGPKFKLKAAEARHMLPVTESILKHFSLSALPTK